MAREERMTPERFWQICKDGLLIRGLTKVSGTGRRENSWAFLYTALQHQAGVDKGLWSLVRLRYCHTAPNERYDADGFRLHVPSTPCIHHLEQATLEIDSWQRDHPYWCLETSPLAWFEQCKEGEGRQRRVLGEWSPLVIPHLSRWDERVILDFDRLWNGTRARAQSGVESEPPPRFHYQLQLLELVHVRLEALMRSFSQTWRRI